uniref:Uncharacterized protein n=1 Tax=Arundo donax TaxID=35708 RepID=A0A0A8ZPN1_ARUDO
MPKISFSSCARCQQRSVLLMAAQS